MSTTSLLAEAAAAAGLCGGAAQAATGFGFALVAVPLLALSSTPRDAVIIVTLTSALVTAGAAVRDRADVDRALAWRVSAAAVVGMPAGLVALLLLPQRWLGVGVAVVAVAFVGWSMTGRLVRAERGMAVGAGLLSGAALTATGMNGPPLVAAMQALRLPQGRQRATLQAVFCFQDVVAVVAFAALGQLPTHVWLLAMCSTPAAALGWGLGDRWFRRVDERAARRLVTALLLASAATLSIRAGFG